MVEGESRVVGRGAIGSGEGACAITSCDGRMWKGERGARREGGEAGAARECLLRVRDGCGRTRGGRRERERRRAKRREEGRAKGTVRLPPDDISTGTPTSGLHERSAAPSSVRDERV